MSKARWALLLLPVLLLCLFIQNAVSYAVSANVDVTNWATINYDAVSFQTNSVVTVGPIYGLGPMTSSSNLYFSPPNHLLKIPMTFSNNGNDADSNAQIFIQFISNNNGYSGTSNWTCYIELGGTNSGTNYDIPFVNFGEGAVFGFNLVVVVPPDAYTGSAGFVKATVITASNSGHVAAVYNGLNGVTYGGVSNSSKQIEVDIGSTNSVAYLSASDGIDTITVFDGSMPLRRTAQTVTVGYNLPLVDNNSAYIWFDIDNTADGPGGANPNDKQVKMKWTGGRNFTAAIDESSVSTGSQLSFLLQVDGMNYANGYLYKLMSLAQQDKYETVLMHNVVTRGSGELVYIKLPAKVLGTSGKILVYSVSGDLVLTILNGNAGSQVISWDGNDLDKKQVARGLYFVVFDFANLKEVRKVFVK